MAKRIAVGFKSLLNLSEEQKQIGRRNFLKVVVGAPALLALGAAAISRGPISFGPPVRAAVIGTGVQGRGLINLCQKGFIDLRAICDINPKRRQNVFERMVKAGWEQPRQYDDWRDMLQKEELEAVIIATPLWSHGEIAMGCLNAGKHVLCEKMMAKTEEEAKGMLDASRKNSKVLEIGHQRHYNHIYQAAYENIVKPGLLGEVHYAHLCWHRNGNGRRKEDPPAENFDASKWGYPDWEHLLNWHLYKQYSEGLTAELGSHQIAIANWFFDSAPQKAFCTGGIHRFKDGREVFDHVYATFEYPGGRTATFTSIQSNAFGDAYEMFTGTKGTLILANETEAYLFNEGEKASGAKIEVSPQSTGPVADSSSTQPDGLSTRTVTQTQTTTDRWLSYKTEIAGFCSAIRSATPLRCGPEKAFNSTVAILSANRSADEKTKVAVARG